MSLIRNRCATILFFAIVVCAAELNLQALGGPVEVDDARTQSAGIRKLEGRHLTLYTDLASAPEVDELPAVFDRAVPLWAEYFGIDAAKTADWRVRGFLIGDRAKFDALGLMPANDGAFAHGLSQGSDFWFFEQPSAYYRRHLLLHEGTHAFMNQFLGGCGPGWYMEGMAELFGTHAWKSGEGGVGNGELRLRVMPRAKEEVSMWGRVKLLRDAVAETGVMELPAVMAIDNRRPLSNTEYAWCWAAAKFLDSHPRYRERFRKLSTHVKERDFNDVVQRTFADDWEELLVEWRAFIATLDFGFDFERMAIEFRRGTPLAGKLETGRGGREVTIAADRGWQSSGVWLEEGKSYKVSARGRYQIAAEDAEGGKKAWPCEPGGVTIEYYDGRPLGMLLGVIDSGSALAEPVAPQGTVQVGFGHPIAIGLGCVITPEVNGTLYLRVNDSAGALGDNRGALTITVED